MRKAPARLRIEPGDIYEGCSYHPVLCLGADYTAWEIKLRGPGGRAAKERVPRAKRWWKDGPAGCVPRLGLREPRRGRRYASSARGS